MKKNLVLILLTAALIPALLLSGCGLISPTTEPTPLPPVTSNGNILAEGRIVPRASATLAFPIGGQVESIAAVEGAQVQAGDLLAQLGQREQAQAALAAANLELTAAQQAADQLSRLADLAHGQAQQELAAAKRTQIEAQKAMDDLDTADFREQLDDRQIDVQNAKDDLDDAQVEFDKYKDLDPNNTTRKNAQTALDNAEAEYQQAVYERDLLQNQLDQVAAALDLANAGVTEAQRALDARSAGTDPEEQAVVDARLDNAKAQVETAKQALANYDLVAPFDGRVLDDRDVFVGQWLSPLQPALVLADISTWYVETKDLNELDVVKIEIGQEVEVEADAMSGVVLTGVVESIAETSTEKSGDVVYTVRIKLNDSDSRLRWGMTVQVTFLKG